MQDANWIQTAGKGQRDAARRARPVPFRSAAPLCLGLVACVLLLGLPFARTAHAQQPAPSQGGEPREIVVEHADSLAASAVEGEQRLIGNVRLRQDQTILWADRVTRYPDRSEILFQGNVRIVDEGDTLWADRVLYNRRTKVGQASGQVRLSDGEVQVTAPSGLYFVDEERAEFTEGVTLVDSATVLTSRVGAYWIEEKRAEFYQDVRLEEDRTHLEADSVTFFRETEVALARSRVFIRRLGGEETDAPPDSTLRTLLFGDRAYNDNKAGFSRIEGQPLLVQLQQDSTGAETDTLVIRALLIESFREDSLQRLVAVDSVRIWRSDLAAVADSVAYYRRTLPREEPPMLAQSDAAVPLEAPGAEEDEETHEVLHLFGDPMVWFEQAQVSGDTVRVQARSGSVDSLFVHGQAFAAQLDTTLDRVQQLRGRDLLGIFRQDSLRTLYVGPNAEAIRYLADDENQLRGALQASGDEMVFQFEGDRITRASIRSGVKSTYYAAGILPETLQLEGYRWLPDARPTRAGLLAGTRAEAVLAAERPAAAAEPPPQEAAPEASAAEPGRQ